MKRILLTVVLVLLLTSCGKAEETGFRYDEADFVFEVDQQQVDLEQYIYTTHTIILDDSMVQYRMIGKYTLYVTDTVTDIEYEIPVVIEDTIAPEIQLTEDFVYYYDPGEELDLSEIDVIDNSSENIDFTTNIEDINMNVIGEKSLVITAEDSTGNLTVKEVKVYVRTVIFPEIDIIVYNLSNTSFTVMFDIRDPLRYKVNSYYSISQNGSVVDAGEITSPTISIENLLQDTQYRITIHYTFLIPGETNKVMSKVETVTTLSLFEPIVKMDNVILTQDSLSFAIDMVDPDQLLDDVQVTIKDEEGTIISQRLVGDAPDFSLTELDLANKYTVTLTYTYDLLDGRGEQEYIVEYIYQVLE